MGGGTQNEVDFKQVNHSTLLGLFWQDSVNCFCFITKSCPTLCNPVDCSPPGSSVHGILQARWQGWAAMPSSRGSSWPRDLNGSPASPALAGRFLTTEPPGRPLSIHRTGETVFEQKFGNSGGFLLKIMLLQTWSSFREPGPWLSVPLPSVQSLVQGQGHRDEDLCCMFSQNTPGAALTPQKLCSAEKQQFFFFSIFKFFYLNFLFFIEAHGSSLALEAFSSNISVAVLIKGNLYSDRPSQFLKSLRKCLKSQT